MSTVPFRDGLPTELKIRKEREKIAMKTSRELTIYYVENKCPSKVISTIVYSYKPAFKWAARHLKDDFFVWSYFIFHRSQDSNILHTSTQEILEEIRFDTLGDVETKLKELCDHKVLRKANEPNTYFFEELPPFSEENYYEVAAELQELIRGA